MPGQFTYTLHLGITAIIRVCQNGLSLRISSSQPKSKVAWYHLSLVATTIIAANWQLNISLQNMCNIFSYVVMAFVTQGRRSPTVSFGAWVLYRIAFWIVSGYVYCRMVYLGLVEFRVYLGLV